MLQQKGKEWQTGLKKKKESTKTAYRRLILEQNTQIAKEKDISCK